MPPRQIPPIRNEEKDSSIGNRDGGDLPPPLPPPPPPPLSRRQFFICGSRPFEMRDTFASRFSVT
jgi:hypothetical protein